MTRWPSLAGPSRVGERVTVDAETRVLQVLRGLVAGAVRALEEEPARGASPGELDDLSARLGCSLPSALKAWLSICRGAGIGPGGVFGRTIMDTAVSALRCPP